MATATKLKAELSGKLVKKVEVVGPGEFEAMSDQQLQAFLVEGLAEMVAENQDFKAMVMKELEPVLGLSTRPPARSS